MIDNEKTGLRIYFFLFLSLSLFVSLDPFVRAFTGRLPVHFALPHIYVYVFILAAMAFPLNFRSLFIAYFPSNFISRLTKSNLILSFIFVRRSASVQFAVSFSSFLFSF